MERFDRAHQLHHNHSKSLSLLSELRQGAPNTDGAAGQLQGILARIVASRDFDFGASRDHALRVGALAGQLARVMRLSEDSIRHVELSGLLHDIGKTKIPSELLNKPDRLTDQERRIVETHTTFGFEILMHTGIKLLELPALVALHHHEQRDGKGYPNGLKGESIPLEARLVAVADIYDALTSSRAYRGALEHEVAMKTMVQTMTTKLDPEVFDAFRGMLMDQAKLDDFLSRSVYDLEAFSVSNSL